MAERVGLPKAMALAAFRAAIAMDLKQGGEPLLPEVAQHLERPRCSP